MGLWAAALDVLYPRSCPACGRAGDDTFCSLCLARIPPPAAPLCDTCGLPLGTGGVRTCGACSSRPPAFRRARACAAYSAADHASPLLSVLHRFKYERDLAEGSALSALLVDRCPLDLRAYDVVVPVPLHLRRLRWRGFNQAQHLVLPLAGRAGLGVDAFVLERRRDTAPQVGLDARARRRNVAGAFQVSHPDAVAAKDVLLVDDVYTSGATADACAAALRQAGARSVDVLALAHAVLS